MFIFGHLVPSLHALSLEKTKRALTIQSTCRDKYVILIINNIKRREEACKFKKLGISSQFSSVISRAVVRVLIQYARTFKVPDNFTSCGYGNCDLL